MRIVDLTQGYIVSIASQYLDITQPMYIYHTTEEFLENVEKPFIFLRDQIDYIEYIKTHGFDVLNKYNNVSNENVWLKTQDVFIPETADTFSKITYKEENGEKIPTDGCYIRLYKIFNRTAKHLLYTSSGVHTVSFIKYQLTGAAKDQYMVDFRVPTNNQTYEERLQKFLTRTKPSIKEVRLFHALFKPTSEYFLDFDKAVKTIYGSVIHAADRHRVVTTKAFKEAFMRELKLLFPGLTTAIQKEMPVETIAKAMHDLLDRSIKTEDSDKALDVIDYVVQQGYLADPNTPVGRFPGTVNRLPGNTEPYLDEDVKSIAAIKAAGEENMKEVELTAKEKSAIKNDLDFSDSLIMGDEEPSIAIIESDKDNGKSS